MRGLFTTLGCLALVAGLWTVAHLLVSGTDSPRQTGYAFSLMVGLLLAAAAFFALSKRALLSLLSGIVAVTSIPAVIFVAYVVEMLHS